MLCGVRWGIVQCGLAWPVWSGLAWCGVAWGGVFCVPNLCGADWWFAAQLLSDPAVFKECHQQLMQQLELPYIPYYLIKEGRVAAYRVYRAVRAAHTRGTAHAD